jgi:pimeloyl-ACP methyl ester carboxylesterase
MPHVDVKGTRLWFDVEGAALVAESGRSSPARRATARRWAAPASRLPLDLRGHGRSEWGDPASWTFEVCADDVRHFCDTLGIARPVVYGHSLGSFVALIYAVRHAGHAGALVLHSAMARFDLARIVEEFRRRGGDEAAAIAGRVYGGDRQSVTPEEWATCWRLFGHWVPGDQERARTVVNQELNAPGLDGMRELDVLDQLARVDCPTLVVVGELDPITPVAAAREIVDALPEGVGRLEVFEEAGHFTWRDAPDRYWPLLLDFVRSAHGLGDRGV